MSPTLALARAVADAVLYEGYLLYPYRASATKNQSRWQFGVLGPPGSADRGIGEDSVMAADCLVEASPDATVDVHLRFLQLQRRSVERADAGAFAAVDELDVDAVVWTAWEEAVEHDVLVGSYALADLRAGTSVDLDIPAGRETELIEDADHITVGRFVRRREPIRSRVVLTGTDDGSLVRLGVRVENVTSGPVDTKDEATARSLLGAHLLLAVDHGDFVSLLDPPAGAREAVARCVQHRCWPVMAGPEGQDDLVLVSPIILYDHPVVAPESSVALFDSTEIDEILTLRVLTLTDEEKAEARRTDPRAAEIIDRCEQMTPEEMQQLHGTLRDPRSFSDPPPRLFGPDDVPQISTPVPLDDGVPWWSPESDESVDPDRDVVVIDGVKVGRDSAVTVRPSRRADAQDLFFAGRRARVTGVHFDVDGSTHIGVVLDDDPAADLHEWYGRYLYFAPDELEPVVADTNENDPSQLERRPHPRRKDSRP